MRLAPLLLLALTACFDTSIGRDRDQDGYDHIELGGNDCDDDNPFVHPDAPEVCGDGIDNNCDSAIDEGGIGVERWYVDSDGDGFPSGVVNEGCVRPGDSYADVS